MVRAAVSNLYKSFSIFFAEYSATHPTRNSILSISIAWSKNANDVSTRWIKNLVVARLRSDSHPAAAEQPHNRKNSAATQDSSDVLVYTLRPLGHPLVILNGCISDNVLWAVSLCCLARIRTLVRRFVWSARYPFRLLRGLLCRKSPPEHSEV